MASPISKDKLSKLAELCKGGEVRISSRELHEILTDTYGDWLTVDLSSEDVVFKLTDTLLTAEFDVSTTYWIHVIRHDLGVEAAEVIEQLLGYDEDYKSDNDEESYGRISHGSIAFEVYSNVRIEFDVDVETGDICMVSNSYEKSNAGYEALSQCDISVEESSLEEFLESE